MANVLDIIIPHYQENSDTIDNLLKSIAFQKNVDFSEIGIIFVSDCGKEINRNKIDKKYRELNVTILENEKNLGPGLSRQRGLDYSKAKYITFLDCDDEFYSDESLSRVISRMEEKNDNVLVTSIVEVTKEGRRFIEHKHMPNTIAGLHGLYIKRSYLVDNGIGFSKELWHCEDSYFYRICCYTTIIDAIDLVTYKWNYNQESIVRKPRKHDYQIVSFDDHAKQIVLTFDYVKKKGCPYGDEFIDSYLVKAIYGLYILLISDYFKGKDLVEERSVFTHLLVKMFLNYRRIFEQFEPNYRTRLLFEELEELKRTNPKVMVTEPFEAFVNKELTKNRA